MRKNKLHIDVSEETKKALNKSKQQIKEGRIHSLEKVKKMFSI